MGRLLVPARPSAVEDPVVAAGSGAESLAAPNIVSTVITVAGPFGAILSLLAIGIIVGLIWSWRRPRTGAGRDLPALESVCMIDLGFVLGAPAERWLPATVLRLAHDGVFSIVDARASGDEGGHGIFLRFDAEPSATNLRARDGDFDALVATEMFGGRPRRGSVVPAERTGRMAPSVNAVATDGFLRAAELYRVPEPYYALRSVTVAGVLGIAFGFAAAAYEPASDMLLAFGAIVVGGIALIFRAAVRRRLPLNADGVVLRDHALALSDLVSDARFDGDPADDRLLPFAVLFDDRAAIRRSADAAARRGEPPTWYHHRAPFSAAALASCVEAVTIGMAQNITLGATLPWAGGAGPYGLAVVADGSGGGGLLDFGDGGGGGDGGSGDFGGGGDGGGGGGGD